jgi:pimeloyl-ACP methyl ester carboxylesterase
MTAVRPLVLVHGWAGSFDRTWRRSGLVDLLADAGRVVAPYDLPGHGNARKSHDPDDYRDLAGDLRAHVGTLRGAVAPDAGQGARPVVDAVGFSLGAITLLRAVVREPHSFGCVVLAGIGDRVFHAHDPSRMEHMLAGLEGRAEPGDVTARIFGKIGNEPHNDPLALAAVLRRPREEPFTPGQLAAIDNEVTVVLGDEDFSAPADALAAAFASGRLVTLKGVDHFRTPEAFEFIDVVMETFAA